MKEIRIASYMRLSREDKETEESQSIGNQREIINAYINSVSEFVEAKIEEYIDDGYSGLTMNRLALQKLLQKVQEGSIDVIIVKDFSRFARNYIEQGHFLEVVFPLASVRFISVNDCYDSKEVSRLSNQFHIAIPAMVNHLYSKDLSTKIKTAKQSLIKAGKMRSSRAPYGYAKDKTGEKPYIIEEETVKIVRLIFAMAAEGKKIMEIAKTLNNNKILSPGAYKAKQGLGGYVSNGELVTNPWEYSAVRNILDDERYIGTLVLGKSERKVLGSSNGSRLPKESWLRFPDAFEPIVSEDTFYQVQNQKKKGSVKPKKVKNLSILYKKVRCKNCGRLMKYKDESYYCRMPLLMDNTDCFSGYIKEKTILDIVFFVLKMHIQLAETFLQLVKKYNKKKQLKFNTASYCLTELERQGKELVTKKGELYEAFKKGKLSKEEYISNKELLQRQYDGIQREMEVLKNERATSSIEENQFLKTSLPFTKEEFLTNDMVNALIDVVYIENRTHIIVKLKYEDCCNQMRDFVEKYEDDTYME